VAPKNRVILQFILEYWVLVSNSFTTASQEPAYQTTTVKKEPIYFLTGFGVNPRQRSFLISLTLLLSYNG
jgi:hypothetical protein